MEEKLIEEFLKVEKQYGSGSGSGYSYGSGDGSGSGSGYGSGDGSGYGSGDGYGILKYNQHKVYMVDDIRTIITRIKDNIAKGFILNSDMTLTPTFIVKGSNKFAHGETVKEAMKSLQEKILNDLDLEEKIQEFKKHFNKSDKYKGKEFFDWHHIMTGSCLQGRNSFVKDRGLDLENTYTVKEFLNIVKGSYGWENLKELEEYYL